MTSPVFAFSAEQEEFRGMVRRFVEAHSSESAVRAQMETVRGFDPAVWAAMADPLGLQGLIVPEEFGGQGFGAVELCIVLEEMGRSLLCAPYFSSGVLAVGALLQAEDDDARRALLPDIAAGRTIATLAFAEPTGRWDASGIEATARQDGRVWKIRGTKLYVLDGHTADVVLVAARTSAGIGLFRVSGGAAGLERTLLDTLDPTRKQARLGFDDVEALPVGRDGAGWEVLSAVLDLAAVALAAEQVGGAQRCLETSVAYARDRVQFGRPIGSFQAIKHKCADMLVEVESARSAAYYAAWCAAERSDELPAVASLAKAYCSDAFLHAAGENIQIHGGIGFTWEHSAHLYYRRAKSSALLFGDPAYHREQLAQRLHF
jgi:alkylation response protein AidB-like acyl-CoA dehydrogenase